MSSMDAAWSSFFGSFRDDMAAELAMQRVQSQATFMQNLERLEKGSGYVNKDNVELTNRQYNQMSEEEKAQLKSKATAGYEMRLQEKNDTAGINLSSQKSLIDYETSDEIAGRKINQAEAEGAARARGALNVQQQQLKIQREDNKAKFQEFKDSESYSKLPPSAREVLSIMGDAGLPFEQSMGSVITSITKDVEEKNITSEDLDIASKQLAGNKAYMEAMSKGDPVAGGEMVREVALAMKGIPNDKKVVYTEAIGKVVTDMSKLKTGKERKAYLADIKENRPGAYPEIVRVLSAAGFALDGSKKKPTEKKALELGMSWISSGNKEKEENSKDTRRTNPDMSNFFGSSPYGARISGDKSSVLDKNEEEEDLSGYRAFGMATR